MTDSRRSAGGIGGAPGTLAVIGVRGMSIRVVLADDHGTVRSGLRDLLERAEGIEVVGEAADGAAVVVNARALCPDLMQMDVRRGGRGPGGDPARVSGTVPARDSPAEGGRTTAQVEHLTVRERDVLTQLGAGASNSQLARELGISEATAKTHVSRVLAKLGVQSRTQAALVARDVGLMDGL